MSSAGTRSALNAVVTQRIEVAPGLFILRVAPDGWELPEFEAGQFAVLGLPGTSRRIVDAEEEEGFKPEKVIKRAYSIASSSVAREYMEFYIALVPSGQLTPRLAALEIGDRVWLSERAKGLFTLDEVKPGRHVVLISTGTGLAPYISMLRSRLSCGAAEHFAVLHGARHSWDLGYQAELMTLDRSCPNFSYLSSISRPQEEPLPWGGESGYVQELWTRGLLAQRWGFQPTPENSDVFICGNPSMIESMVEALEGEGFSERKPRQEGGQVHVERYW